MKTMDPEIVISYNVNDIEFVEKIAGKLKAFDWSVWYETNFNNNKENVGEYTSSTKGKAVVNSKVFLIILSLDSVHDKACQNDLALAYITNSIIIPVACVNNFNELGGHLNSGMKLMLSKLNWCFFGPQDDFEKKFNILSTSIRLDLKRIAKQNGKKHSLVDEKDFQKFKVMFRQNSILNWQKKGHGNDAYDYDDEACHSDTEIDSDFWDRHFSELNEISWDVFKQCFLVDYEEQISAQYSYSKLAFFINMIFRDIFNGKQTLQREVYEQFCRNADGETECFYDKLQKYALGYHAMKQVFNMDSEHRLTAIQNLGSFSSPAVIHFLEDMLHESDSNIRAVATIALARAGKGKRLDTIEKISPMLQDDDRLVRESAVLSLGKLKAENCVKAIIDRWRNDPVSQVRSAAQDALVQIGGEEAERCVSVTRLLMKEIESLKKKTEAKRAIMSK